MSPKVTIVIATYNSERTLAVAMESVLNQTFQDWECLIIDGASTDGTIDIIRRYVNSDNRFRYISEPDKGIYDAFNKGWRNATGEWVMYLGSDDEYLPNGLEILMSQCDDVDMIYGDVIIKWPNGFEKSRKAGPVENIINGGPNSLSHQSFAMRINVIDKMLGFDLNKYKILADFDLMVRSCHDGYSCKHVNGFISKFSKGGYSQSTYRTDIEAVKIYSRYNNILLSFKYFVRRIVLRFLYNTKDKYFRR